MPILSTLSVRGKAFALTGRNCSNTRYPGCRFACPGLGAFGLSGRSRPNPKLELLTIKQPRASVSFLQLVARLNGRSLVIIRRSNHAEPASVAIDGLVGLHHA